jgi:hypothetical protein
MGMGFVSFQTGIQLMTFLAKICYRCTRFFLPAMKFRNLFFVLVFGQVCFGTTAQQPTAVKDEHSQGVNARGDQGMGFSHEKTTHHFHLLADGGAIEIHSNEPTDAKSQEAIRQHLAMIAVRFSQGDFAIPMFIHSTVPPGVAKSFNCFTWLAGEV